MNIEINENFTFFLLYQIFKSQYYFAHIAHLIWNNHISVLKSNLWPVTGQLYSDPL